MALPTSPQQRAFLSGFVKTTGLDPNVSAAWLRNEEPAISQNTDPAGHGRYNFLNVGITDNKSYSASSPYWNDPVKAGQATGNWLAGRLSLPGYGKSSGGIQGITKTAGLTPRQQIRAIQQSGWASGGETALPGLYRQALGGGGVTLPRQAGAASAPLTAADASSVSPPAAQSLPALSTAFLPGMQSSFDREQQSNQRALDALGKISGRSVQAAAAPDLSSLMAQTGGLNSEAVKTLKTATPQHTAVPLSGKVPTTLHPQAQKAIELAKHYLGSAYVYGGASPKTGFDCSGLLQYVWGQNGVKIPRTAAEQYHAGKPVAANKLQAGDALYFQTEGGANGVTHAAMYIGNGQILESPHTGDVVKIAPLAGYYQQHLVGARRFA